MDQSLIDAAVQVKQGVMSLGAAAKSLGLTIEQFQTKLGDLLALNNRFGIRELSNWDVRHAVLAVRQMAPIVESGAPVAAAGGGLVVTEGSTGLLATVAGWLGISVGTLAVGALVVGAVVVGGVVYMKTRSADKPAQVETRVVEEREEKPPPCPPLVKEARLCPWSPKSAAAKPCGPGFCWDGGFNGSLSCKQETLPEHAIRLDLSGASCDFGYAEQRDRCTGVIMGCIAKSKG